MYSTASTWLSRSLSPTTSLHSLLRHPHHALEAHSASGLPGSNRLSIWPSGALRAATCDADNNALKARLHHAGRAVTPSPAYHTPHNLQSSHCTSTSPSRVRALACNCQPECQHSTTYGANAFGCLVLDSNVMHARPWDTPETLFTMPQKGLAEHMFH